MSAGVRIVLFLALIGTMLFTALGSLVIVGLAAGHSGPMPSASRQLDGVIAFCGLYAVGALIVAVQTLVPG
jgi:hypothetical protein